MNLSVTDIAWLAGLLEGEGSFFMLRSRVSGKLYRYPHIVVAMTDRDVVTRAATLFGKALYRAPKPTRGDLTTYRTCVTGKDAIGWMFTLFSFMGLRRKARMHDCIEQWRRIASTTARRSASCQRAARKRWAK